MPLCNPLFDLSEFLATNEPPAVLNNAPPTPNAIDVTAITGATIYDTERVYAMYVMADNRSTFFSPARRMTADAPEALIARKK